MIKKDPAKSYEIMGADVKQSGEQFAKSAPTCAGRTRRQPAILQGPIQAFSKESATCCSKWASSSRFRT
jgi:NitT/TauT family transport system substrate-binding protein